jgi:glycosyltransferase involved in cell wall biosynthesis
MQKITGIIICKNEEDSIEECLKSISWCDEIVVVDSGSTDKTIEIAKKYTDKIFFNEWKGFSEQRKFALTKVSNEWVFVLDADERCTDELASEIKTVLSFTDFKSKGFYIPRKSFFLNKWVKHCGWYPDYKLRLFDKNFVKISDRLVHEGYEVNAETNKLKNDILHYTVNSISEFTEKINHYSSLSALEKANKKKITFLYLFFIPSFEFAKKFIFQAGFLDGITGLMVSYFHMITKLLTYMKMREIQNKQIIK